MSNVFSRRRSRVRATRHDCKDVIFKSRTTDGRPARGGAEFPSLRTFSVPARGGFHESENRNRKRTRQIEENPTAGARDLRTEHPRKRRATKIRSENANACDAPEARGIARNGAELRNCVSPAVSSFRRSRRKLVETGSRDALGRLRGVAVLFLITAAPGG